MKRCMGHRESPDGEVYRCTLEEYHGGNCHFTTPEPTIYDVAHIKRERYMNDERRIMVNVWHKGEWVGAKWFDGIEPARAYAKGTATHVHDHTGR
jgi:hypothetical protein